MALKPQRTQALIGKLRCQRSSARIRHVVTRRSQETMHLLSFTPPPGLAHLPTQFAARSSHRRELNELASAAELKSTPVPMRLITKKRCRVMDEPPEKGPVI